MILRRVIGHFRKQEWTAIAIDFVIVVAGVFVGLQVQEWNADRQTRAKSADFSERLREDLRMEAWQYEFLIKYNQDVLANANRAIAALSGEGQLSDEQLLVSVYRASNYKYYERRRATYDELISTGAIGLITDTNLRQTAVSVFTNPLFNVITQEGKESNLRKIFRETTPAGIQHALLKNYGDAIVEPFDLTHIAGSLDYPCTLDLPPGRLAAAASKLKGNAALVPALQLRFADVETAITDLQINNLTMLQNLRAIVKEGTPLET